MEREMAIVSGNELLAGVSVSAGLIVTVHMLAYNEKEPLFGDEKVLNGHNGNKWIFDELQMLFKGR